MTSNVMILVAEDEESDALLLRMALKKAGISNPITVVRDGQEAVAYLKGDAPYSDRTKYPLPGLLLVDLNMPRMNGFGLLSWLAAHPAFKHLPAVVLTSSSQVSDIEKARRLGVVIPSLPFDRLAGDYPMEVPLAATKRDGLLPVLPKYEFWAGFPD